VAKMHLSPSGVQRHLQDRLRNNELFRYQIFKGKFGETFSEDKLDGAEARIKANFSAGLM
jgi:hypothetical protein